MIIEAKSTGNYDARQEGHPDLRRTRQRHVPAGTSTASECSWSEHPERQQWPGGHPRHRQGAPPRVLDRGNGSPVMASTDKRAVTCSSIPVIITRGSPSGSPLP
jgi:hypothetical protein